GGEAAFRRSGRAGGRGPGARGGRGTVEVGLGRGGAGGGRVAETAVRRRAEGTGRGGAGVRSRVSGSASNAGWPDRQLGGRSNSRASGAALCRHSCHSVSGSESAVIPPPTPIRTVPSLISKVRIATFSSIPATGEARPIAPV